MFNNQEKAEKLKELYGEYPSEDLRLAHQEHAEKENCSASVECKNYAI